MRANLFASYDKRMNPSQSQSMNNHYSSQRRKKESKGEPALFFASEPYWGQRGSRQSDYQSNNVKAVKADSSLSSLITQQSKFKN